MPKLNLKEWNLAVAALREHAATIQQRAPQELSPVKRAEMARIRDQMLALAKKIETEV